MTGLGAMMILVGFGGVGLAIISGLNRQVVLFRSMIQALDYMEREISFHLTPLPQLYRGLSSHVSKPLSTAFAWMADGLEALQCSSAEELWEQSLSQLEFGSEGLAYLLPLGQVLGCYDADHQCKAMAQARAQLSQILVRREVENAKGKKLYGTLSLALGGLVVILLL